MSSNIHLEDDTCGFYPQAQTLKTPYKGQKSAPQERNAQ